MLKIAKITLSLLLLTALSSGVQSQTVLVAESDTICVGDSTRIFASGSASYAWSPSTGLNQVSGDTVWANPSSSTTYTVIGTSDTVSITITVNNLPNISISSSADTVCVGTQVDFTAGGASTYSWTGASNTSTSGDSASSSPVASGYIYVTGTDSNSCVQMDSTLVTVNSVPSISMSSSADTVCSGTQIDFIASGASTYTWTGANATSTLGDSASAAPTVSGYVYATGSNGTCTQKDSILITVNALPSVTINASTFVCANTPKAISASGALTYVWSPSSAFNVDTGANVIINIPSGTSISVVGTSANGCSKSTNRTLLVNTTAPAVTAFTNDTITCEGDSVFLSAIGTSADSYVWKDLSGNSLLSSNTRDVYATPTSNSSFRVVSVKNGCADSAEVAVEVNPIPNISLTQTSGGAALCQDVADTITVTSNGVLFVWNIPSSSVTTTAKTKAIAPGITSSIEVVAVSNKGCKNGAILTITVDTSCGEKLNLKEVELLFSIQYNSKQSIFTFSSEDNQVSSSMELIDLHGRRVASSSDSNELQVPELIRGIYILRAQTSQGILSKKYYIE